MNVTVVWATRDVQEIVPLALPPGATVGDAVARSRIIEDYSLDAAELAFAVFGRRAAAAAPLADGDRVEITGRLRADPTESRRRRAEVAAKARDRPPR